MVAPCCVEIINSVFNGVINHFLNLSLVDVVVIPVDNWESHGTHS